jgi:phage terminase large subunit
MKNEEFIAGISRVEAARKLGFVVDVLEKTKIEEGINMARSLLPYCSFDVHNCAYGIKCLDLYQRNITTY